MRMRYLGDYLKMAVTSAVMFPLAMAAMALRRETHKAVDRRLTQPDIDFFGMGVSLEKGPVQFDLIDELGVQHVLIRVPLWDMDRITAYRAFAQKFRERGKTVLINVLQDREHIEDYGLAARDIERVFATFADIADHYQIGNAINRVKWGFFSVQEYLEFFQVTRQLQRVRYPGYKLMGPAVIDLEYHYVIRALFNGSNLAFDQLSSLLYVDRMGSPHNKQYGIFDLDRKIRLLHSLAHLSSKVKDKQLVITEANWPLQGTAPYAPTSETECVSMADYCRYMRDYHQIAWDTGAVSRVYWHQLIAPGYGLIDPRKETTKKTPAFNAYRELIRAT
jgi:hypothetical protein